jgi:hypothetical protein
MDTDTVCLPVYQILSTRIHKMTAEAINISLQSNISNSSNVNSYHRMKGSVFTNVEGSQDLKKMPEECSVPKYLYSVLFLLFSTCTS